MVQKFGKNWKRDKIDITNEIFKIQTDFMYIYLQNHVCGVVRHQQNLNVFSVDEWNSYFLL